MTNSIAKRGQGAIAPCRVKGQRPLWGLGQRPNCSASNLLKGSSQQRCRQRSVPASNFARPQTRPQAAHSTNCAVSRQMGATVLLVGKSKLVFIASRGFRLCGGESGALRSPPTPLRSAHPCFLVFIVAGEFAYAEATKGHENRRMSAVALWKPSAPPLLGLIHLDDNRSVSWRKPNCPPSAPQSFPHAAAPDSQTAPPAPGTAARRPSAPQTG